MCFGGSTTWDGSICRAHGVHRCGDGVWKLRLGRRRGRCLLWSAGYRIHFISRRQRNRRCGTRAVVERVRRTVPLPRLRCAAGSTHQIFCHCCRRADGLPFVRRRSVESGSQGSLDWLERRTTRAQSSLHREQHALRHISLGPSTQRSVTAAGAGGETNRRRLASAVRIRAVAAGNVRRCRAVCRNLLSRGELATGGLYERPRQAGSGIQGQSVEKSCPRLSPHEECNETPAKLKIPSAVVHLCGANPSGCWRGGPSWCIEFWFRKR